MAEIRVIKKVETQVSAEEKAEKLDVIAHALHLPIYHIENFIRLGKKEHKQKPDTFPMLLRSIFDETYIPIINWKAYNAGTEVENKINLENVLARAGNEFYIVNGDVEILGIYLNTKSPEIRSNFELLGGSDKQMLFSDFKKQERLEIAIGAIYDYKNYNNDKIGIPNNEIVVNFPDEKTIVDKKEMQEFVPNKKVTEFLNFIGKNAVNYESTIFYEISDYWVQYQKYIYNGEVPPAEQPKIDIISKSQLERQFKEAFLNAIYYQKFGKPMPVDMGAKEKNIIENEFSRQMKYRAQILGSACPHWEIEKDFRHAVNEIDKMHAYHKLEKFMTAADRKPSQSSRVPQNYIKCTNCKLDMLCPHVRDEFVNKKALKEGQQSDYLHKMIFKYAGEAKVSDAYYCTVCGEAITYNIKMEGFDAFVRGNKVHMSSAEDTLYEFLTGAITYIMTGIQFTGVQSAKFVSAFIKTAADVLIDYIAMQEKIINKSKTASQEESDAKKQLFTDIYIYAFLLKVLNDNPKAFTFRFNTGENKKNKKTNNFAIVSALIISTRNIIINKLNLDTELIQKSLFKAYKLIDTNIKSSKITNTKTKYYVSPDINPVVNYAKKIESVQKGTSDYAKYYFDSYNNFVQYEKSFSVPLYITTILENDTRPTFTLNQNYVAIFEKQEAFLQSQKSMNEQYKMGIRRVFTKTPQYQRTDVQSNNNLLMQKYGVDDKFHVHKWDTFYYSLVGNKKEKKYNAKEFGELDYSEQRQLVVEDVQCGVCGKRRSELVKEKNQLEMLEDVSEFKNFTNYYENKCPEGTTHEFKDNVCKLCKYDRSEPITNAYYKKYKSQFLKDTIKKKSTLTSKPFSGPDEVTKVTKKYYSDLEIGLESYTNWRFNNNIINEFISSTSSYLEKKHNLKRANYTNFIMNLGLTEGYDFNDILSGKENPHHRLSEDSIALLRIQRLESYIHEFLISQNIIRNHSTMSSIPPDLEPIIKGRSAPQKTKNVNGGDDILGDDIIGGKPKETKKPKVAKKEKVNKKPKETKKHGRPSASQKPKAEPPKSIANEYFGALEKMKILYYGPGGFEKLSNFMYDALMKLILKVVRDGKMPLFVSYVLERIYESEKGFSKMKEKQAVQISAAQIGYDANNDNLVDNSATKDYDGLVSEADLQKTIYSEIDYDGEND